MDRLPAFFDFNPVSTPKEPSVNAILNERIGERVSALRISWRRASLEAGLEAGFIQDVITAFLNRIHVRQWRAQIARSVWYNVFVLETTLNQSRANLSFRTPEASYILAPWMITSLLHTLTKQIGLCST